MVFVMAVLSAIVDLTLFPGNLNIYKEIFESVMLSPSDKLLAGADLIFQPGLAAAYVGNDQKPVKWPWNYCARLVRKPARSDP